MSGLANSLRVARGSCCKRFARLLMSWLSLTSLTSLTGTHALLLASQEVAGASPLHRNVYRAARVEHVLYHCIMAALPGRNLSQTRRALTTKSGGLGKMSLLLLLLLFLILRRMGKNKA